MEVILRAMFALGGMVLLSIWGKSREKPLSYFLFRRLDLKARTLSLAVLLLGILQFWEVLSFRFGGENILIPILGLGIFWTGIFLASWGKLTLGPNWDPGGNYHHQLIDWGAYQICRHPIYLGGFLAGLGAEVSLQSPFALLALPGFLLLKRACLTEERQLLQHFGEEYQRYQEKVKRFIFV